MTVIIGTPTATLLVEADDAEAKHTEGIFRQFPGATVVRVRTSKEALDALGDENQDFDQVCINGLVWTPEQALPFLL
jgi:hypothetical protein